ncbi:MAG: hypothetical protein GX929_07485 [Clostridiales bacterium]|nr:hypothetical protein [Clostridiales bacterium]
MADVIGIGAAVYDTLMLTASFPIEDTKIRATQTLIQGGGPCTTALNACAKLGVSAAYIGSVGDDHAGDFIAEDLRRWGVDTTYLYRKPGCISFHSFVILNQSASTRTCVANAGTAPQPQPCEVPADAIRAAKVLHLDGNSLDAAVCAARIAKAAGVKVSLDAGSPYPGIETLLPFVDWLIPSEEFVRQITGQNDTERGAKMLWAEYHPQSLIVTQGAHGGFIRTDDGVVRYPAFPVEVIDTCGAGDVFHGAYIVGRVRGMDELKASTFASAVSALKCTGFGARESTPTLLKVSQFLKARGF